MERKCQKISVELWRAARDSEREDAIHPCEHADPEICFCKGACSCHWVEWVEESFCLQISKEDVQ